VVDSFDPHEPWDPPEPDRKLYLGDGDSNDDDPDVIHSLYGPWDGRLTRRQLKRLQANYAGEVTMVDRWFGHFMDALRSSGRLETTVVAVMSDHGHNLGYEPGDKGLVSKQGHPMTHAVADLVLMVRDPTGRAAGTACDGLIYRHDVVVTLLALAGVRLSGVRDAIDFWPAVLGEGSGRSHVTIGWGPLVTVITDEWWFNASIRGDGRLLYCVWEDSELVENLAELHPGICEQLAELAVQDAGGAIPREFAAYYDQPGCTPFEDVSLRWRRVHGQARAAYDSFARRRSLS
jgi:arylsulfatase A-like enzyme